MTRKGEMETDMENSEDRSQEITYLNKRLHAVLNRLVKKTHRVNCCLSPNIVDPIINLDWGNIGSIRTFLDMLEEVDQKGEFPDRGAAERLKGLLEFLLCPYFTARLEEKP